MVWCCSTIPASMQIMPSKNGSNDIAQEPKQMAKPRYVLQTSIKERGYLVVYIGIVMYSTATITFQTNYGTSASS